MKIKTILIDEENSWIQGLTTQLKDLSLKVDVVGTASGIEDGYQVIKSSSPDLVFLDTNFCNGTGFELLNKFQTIDFQVIFTATCEEYAMQAFKVHAADYLLKPVNQKVLDLAMTRVHQTLCFGSKKKNKNKFSSEFNRSIRNKKLAIKESKSINYIDIDEIVHMKADGNYTNIFLKNGQNLISSKVLKYYDELLSDFGFLRVHRSNMINLNYVKEFRHKYGGSIVLKNDEIIGIAPDKKKMFFNRLGMV